MLNQSLRLSTTTGTTVTVAEHHTETAEIMSLHEEQFLHDTKLKTQTKKKVRVKIKPKVQSLVNRPGILILDLDETLVNSTMEYSMHADINFEIKRTRETVSLFID